MNKIPLNSNPNQEFVLIIGDKNLHINLVHSALGGWFVNLRYEGTEVNSVKLSCGVLHLESNNFPFDFWVSTDSTGIDPYGGDDFVSRCSLYILDKAEIETLKGTEIRA